MRSIAKKHKRADQSEVNELIKKEWKIIKHFRDENKVLVMSIVWLLIAIIVINTIFVVARLSDRDEKNDARVVAASYAGVTLTSQQYAQTTAFAAHISNVYETAQEDHAFPLDPDQTMLILNLTVTNNTTTEQDLYPVNQLFVRDQEGGTYTPHASMFITQPLAAQTVKPGQTVTGQISFAIPKRLTRPLLYVDTRWDNQAPVVFDVLR
jgi:hypothetical protein